MGLTGVHVGFARKQPVALKVRPVRERHASQLRRPAFAIQVVYENSFEAFIFWVESAAFLHFIIDTCDVEEVGNANLLPN